MMQMKMKWMVRGAVIIGVGFGGACLVLLLMLLLLTSLLPSVGTGPTVASASMAGSRPVVVPASFSQQVKHAWTGPRNQAVVDQAIAIAAALYPGPPHNYTTWYHADQIPAALAYWQRTCTGGCAENWAQGNLQCTMLVTASYGLAGQDVPFAGDAATWWTWHRYRDQPGWQEIAATELPWPGDILVWDSGTAFGGAGHIAIIVDVRSPDGAGQGGYVQFAQANAGSALAQEPLVSTSRGPVMQTWTGYTVLGYLRHTAFLA